MAKSDVITQAIGGKATATMSIETFTNVSVMLPANISILIRGEFGIGKSQLVKQIATILRRKYPDLLGLFPCTDKRLSQMSEGDMIGLPSTDGNVTRFNPPDWYMQACEMPCCLFLDEINRATLEIMQSAFQIVLDRELNGWKLHPQTRVFSAINVGASYIVNDMDPALIDRYWVIDLKPTLQDWLTWARNKDPELGGNIHENVTDFIQAEPVWLDPAKDIGGRRKTTSRRSWERVNNSLVGAKLIDDPDNPMFWAMCLGFVGVEATNAFHKFVKHMDTRFTGEDILNRYAKVRHRIVDKGQDRLISAIDKCAKYMNDEINTISDKHGKNLRAFMEDLTGELRITLWTKITGQSAGANKFKLAQELHKHCTDLMLSSFGVPRGQAGVGKLPNMPGFIEATQAKDK